MSNFTKPYLAPPDQLALLKSRNMSVSDDCRAIDCLSRVGYYRLSAYWHPLRKPENGTLLDDFLDGAEFSTVADLYIFDKKLRLICMDALERIEIALRTDIALFLGKLDPWAHRLPQYLHGTFTKKAVPKYQNRTAHAEWLRRQDTKFHASKEDFAKHFRAKYPSDHPPIWVAVELWDFGTLSHFFAGMRFEDRTSIAERYGIPNGNMLSTWIRCLNDIRNLCAHHSRLWNRPLVSRPSWPRAADIPELSHVMPNSRNHDRLYAAALIMRWLLKTINPPSQWHERLESLMGTFPGSPLLSIQGAGFPSRWADETIWV